MAFTYAPEWLAWENTLPISRALPLRPERYTGPPVIAVFENLLPDSDLVRRRLAERVGADGMENYSLLARIGRDCVRALHFLPEGEVPGDARPLPKTPASRFPQASSRQTGSEPRQARKNQGAS